MDDELDGLLRATFRAREPQTPDASGLAAAARSGHARRTARRRQLAAVGTVGVLAAGGSSMLALAGHGSNRAPDSGPTAGYLRTGSSGPTPGQSRSTAAGAPSTQGTTSPGGAVTARPLPNAGTRAWSSHGLQIRVPEAWKANQIQCSTPIANTVIIGDGMREACMLSSTPAVDVVQFSTQGPVDLNPQPSLSPTTIDGHRTQTGTEQLSDGRTATVLIVPDLDVWVTVKSKDPALVAGIVATAQIVDTDAHGCASRVDSVEPAGKPARPGARDTMVPGKPVKAIVCHYAAPWSPDRAGPNSPTLLTNGSEISPDHIGALTGMLNSLKPGLATWKGLAGACAPAAHDGYLFRFSYSSGPPVDVYLHTDNCDRMGFDNGAVTGYVPSKLADNAGTFLPDMGVAIAGEAVR